MAGDSRLSARFGADTTDFKTGISAISREIRVLESGFKASTAVLGDWTKSADGLEQRAKSLTDQIELQKEKVGALTVEYERIVEAKGKDSVAAQNALIDLNKQTAALGSMENELATTETALNEMGTESEDSSKQVEDLSTKTEDASTKFETFQGVLKTAVGVIAGVAAAVVGLGGAIAGMVLNATNAAGELVDLSIKTGMSTTRLQELDYVAKQVGTSTETITGAMARLTRGMGAAQEQSGEFAEKQQEAYAKVQMLRGEFGLAPIK